VRLRLIFLNMVSPPSEVDSVAVSEESAG